MTTELPMPDPSKSMDRLVRLYTEYTRRLIRLILRVPAIDFEDVFQSIMLEVIRSYPKFEHNGSVGAFRKWLRKIIVRKGIAYWKKRGSEKKAIDRLALRRLADLDNEKSLLNRSMDRLDAHLLVEQALQELEGIVDPMQIVAFRRVELGGEKVSDVALDLGVQPREISDWKYRIRGQLRRRIGEWLG